MHIDGKDAGQWRLPAVPGEWLENAFLISADLVTETQTLVAITVEEMFNVSPEARYSPFYYWAYQGGAIGQATPQPQNASQVAFGNVAQLQGYDLSETTINPGNTLSLTLYWLALDPPHADLRIFAHLVDPTRADTAEGIIAQADSTPHQGTYPFWVWQMDDVVDDTLLLTIPSNASPGKYLLLVGIYDTANGQRLPIIDTDDFGAGRLLLTTIAIR